jgi:hypothetical protein
MNTPVQITLTGSDPIPGDVLKFSIVGNPQQGSLTSGSTGNTVTYTPNTGFFGTDRFTYKSTDGLGVDSNVATVTITVSAPPPTAKDESIQTNSGTPVQITLTGTDPIPGDVLKFSIVGNPQHGTVTPGTVSSIVFYTPNTGFVGTDSFTYKATDGQGVDSNIATVTITVSSSSSGNTDKFGVNELYPTKANGEQWYFNPQNPTSDPQLNPNGVTLTRNADGSYKVQSSQVRLQVYTSSGYHRNLITTYDQQVLAQKGYMQSPNDWKNVEITGYMKVNHFTTSTTNGAAHLHAAVRILLLYLVKARHIGRAHTKLEQYNLRKSSNILQVIQPTIHGYPELQEPCKVNGLGLKQSITHFRTVQYSWSNGSTINRIISIPQETTGIK